MEFLIKSFDEDPTGAKRLGELEDDSFPVYLNEEPIWLRLQEDILKTFAKYHFIILKKDTGEAAGVSINVPLAWDEDPATLPGYNELLELCLKQNAEGKKPTALVAILAAVSPNFRGQGISELFNEVSAQLLKQYGIKHYMSPIRPSIKQFYPTHTMDEFLDWRTAEGGLIDPWLNHFAKMGSTNLGIAHDAITLTAPIEQWEKWTGMVFPVSGQYVIPGGHRMLSVDRDKGTARYGEDHLWFDIPLLP